MKINSFRNFVGLILCLFLTFASIESDIIDEDTDLNVINAAIPGIAGLVGMCVTAVPLGPILVAGLGVLHIASMVFYGFDDDSDVPSPATTLDLMECQTAIINEIKDVGTQIQEQSDRIIRELTHLITAHPFLEDMRNTLGYIERTCSDETEVVLSSKLTGIHKNSTMMMMIDPHSTFRDTIRFFVTKFIQKRNGLRVIKNDKFFFEYILEEDSLLAIENDDHHLESMHSQIFKSFMYIIKILTDSYVLPIAAQAIYYVNLSKLNQTSDAYSMKRDSFKLINDYKTDMKALIDKTKWALGKASREIRNTDKFIMKEGKNVAHLDFIQTFPRVFHQVISYQESNHAFNLTTHKVGPCESHRDLVELNSKVSVYRDKKNLDKPFHYMIMEKSDGGRVIFGREKSNLNLYKDTTDIIPKLVFCSAFRRKSYAISNERISAKPGYVITGLRFRVEDYVVYIDIQQGKFIDVLSVDPKTVHWVKTPSGGPKTYLNSFVRKLEIGDFEWSDKRFLTSIQLKPGPAIDGFIFVYAGGILPQNWTYVGDGCDKKIPPKGLVKIGYEDPRRADISENKITKLPKKINRYYIKFQESGLKEDFGRTTIPLIDTRKVVSDPPAPLSGFGIYHQGASNSGGVLSLKLISPQLESYASYDLIEKFVEVSNEIVK